MTTDNEYLVSYGRAGDFGRFQATQSVRCRRGDRVVIRAGADLDIGVVLCQADAGHARFLSRTSLGELLRIANDEDERTAQRRQALSQEIFDHARRLTEEHALPLEIVDAEVCLGGKQAAVYYLCRQSCDYRSLVSSLARIHDLAILMHNLALPAVEEEDHGCGKPGCGKTEGGGCSSCGSGGCSTCGKSTHKDEVAAYLVGLRTKMEESSRTSLL